MKTVKQFFTLILLVGFILSKAPFAYATERQQKVYYFLHDHLGGISAVTDEQGNVVERRDYLPFGSDRLIPDAQYLDYGFTGKEKDPESELYYYGARYYDPFTGRFISPDPLLNALDTMNQEQLNVFLSDPQNLNMYTYVRNNPVRFIDPTGEYEADVHYDLTFYLGRMAGLSYEQSQTVAFFNQNMDIDPATAPANFSTLKGTLQTIKNSVLRTTKRHHFAPRAVALVRLGKAIKDGSLENFGKAMHTFQDSYSHEGYDDNHVLDGHQPDKTYNDVAKANTMAQASLYVMRLMNLKLNGGGDLNASEYEAETKTLWNTIAQKVSDYNATINKLGTDIHVMGSGARFSIKAKKEEKK